MLANVLDMPITVPDEKVDGNPLPTQYITDKTLSVAMVKCTTATTAIGSMIEILTARIVAGSVMAD